MIHEMTSERVQINPIEVLEAFLAGVDPRLIIRRDTLTQKLENEKDPQKQKELSEKLLQVHGQIIKRIV